MARSSLFRSRALTGILLGLLAWLPAMPLSAAPANTAPANTAPANTAPANTAPANTAPANGFRHIALDAGHSIKTQGAISARGVAEFDFNRQLVLALEAAFHSAGARTTLTGVEGLTTDLVSRPRQAAQAGAQLFVSVHHDSAKARFHQDWQFEGQPRKFLDGRFSGFSLFVSRHNRHWPLALKCASAIGAQLIAQGFKPSRYHADPVLGSAREYADETHGVHFFDNLAVLRQAAMPALLMEAGVIVKVRSTIFEKWLFTESSG